MRLKNIKRSFSIAGLVGAVLGFASVSFALIGEPTELPNLIFDSEGILGYDYVDNPGTGIMQIESVALVIEFDDEAKFAGGKVVYGYFLLKKEDPDDTDSGIIKTLFIKVELEVSENESGDLVVEPVLGGIDGDELLVKGDLRLILFNEDSGLYTTQDILDQVMLRGKVEEFEFRFNDCPSDPNCPPTGIGTHEFVFRFSPTGGFLVTNGLFPNDRDIIVQVISEHSTFSGDFTCNFTGGAKGNAGSSTQPSIDGCPLDHFMGYKFKTTKSCQGGVTELTIQYTGGADDVITVIAEDKVLYEATVDQFFTFDNGGQKLGKEIEIFVNYVSPTTIHTSCSQPIGPDMIFDSFTVVGGESLEGGDLEEATTEFEPQVVALTDQFEEMVEFKVKKPYTLYNPADKDSEGICDFDTHLVGYEIKRVKGQPKHQKRTIVVENQFGLLHVDMKKPDRLLVPTAKDLENPVDAPVNADHNVDHYKCYKVKVTKGTDKFPKGIQVTVVDQFDQPKLYDVKKPSRLCIPVDKNGEGIKNDSAYLMFYKVKPAEGELEHEKVLDIYTNNQSGRLKFDTKKEEELGVPSQVVELAQGLFTCDKPIDELTMIWDCTEPIQVKAWKGVVDSTSLELDVDDINDNGFIDIGEKVTVSGYAGSPKDVYWEIFDATGTNNKLGESTFHLSCSDEDMNGPEDCGNRQGDGKYKSGFINDWILAGMVDATGAFDCTP